MLQTLGAFIGRLLIAVAGAAAVAGALALGFVVAASFLLRLAWLRLRQPSRGLSPVGRRAGRASGEVIDVEVREVRVR
ncbi:MAG TPA: hypothetical protein VJ608_05050 [Albitalea sp.]|nr:hypothetical protein [Albitalea sp.]